MFGDQKGVCVCRVVKDVSKKLGRKQKIVRDMQGDS